MPEVEFVNLLAVVAIALLAPLLLGLSRTTAFPSVVVEIVAGVVVGPSGLGWVTADLPVQVLALLGLAFLLFLAGLEIELPLLRGGVLRVALLGYAVTLALGTGVGFGLSAVGWVSSPVLVAVALSATSLGLVVPVLRDAGRASSGFGQTVIACSSVADLAAIVLLSLFFSTSGGTLGDRALLLGGFAVLVGAVAASLLLAGRSMQLGTTLERLQDTTAEIRVRAAVVLLIAFVAAAEKVGIESILGAFLAGTVVGFVDRDRASHRHFRVKLQAVGYGFLVPVFFVSSGLGLDVRALASSPSGLLMVPVLLAALLVVRGVPALLLRREHGLRTSLAAGLLQATSLPFLVAAAQIGVVTGRIGDVTATALVAAGLVSVVLFPLAALSLLGRDETPAEQPVPERSPAQR